MKYQDVFRSDGTLMAVPEPICGHAMRLSYYARHVPSGRVFNDSALFVNREAFASCLARWNQQQPENWHYTEKKPEELDSSLPTG